MILTEGDLSPFRDANGWAHLPPLPEIFERNPEMLPAYARRVALPDSLLTPTHNVFEGDWHAPGDVRGHRETLQAIPVLAFRKRVPVLSPALTWYGLIHQCSGFYCQQMRMVAARLRPRPEIALSLDAIVREYYDADAGLLHHDNLRASQIVDYVRTLERLGLNCETSWRNLTEAAFPSMRRRKILISSRRVHRYSAPSPTGPTSRTTKPLSCSLPGTATERRSRNGFPARRNGTRFAGRTRQDQNGKKPGPRTQAFEMPKRRSIRGRGLRSAS